MTDYDKYIGNELRQSDVITPALLERYRAVIGHDGREDNLPYGLHFCLCLPKAAMAELGTDGHPAKGGFLPESDLPRRMWASSQIDFLAPCALNAPIVKHSKVQSVKLKSGRSGKLLFVNVEHLTKCAGVDAIRETQTIVYREASSQKAELPVAAKHSLAEWEHTEALTPNEAMLFRYSALTFNTHRIHYDLPYTVNEEGYPALVVHGPLMASLLLRFAASLLKDTPITSFQFRGLAPAYCNEPLTIAARGNEAGLELSIIGCDGRAVMSGTAGTGAHE